MRREITFEATSTVIFHNFQGKKQARQIQVRSTTGFEKKNEIKLRSEITVHARAIVNSRRIAQNLILSIFRCFWQFHEKQLARAQI